jgi:hypothetical protein
VGSFRVALAGIHRNSASGVTSLIVYKPDQQVTAARGALAARDQPTTRKVRHNPSEVVGGRSYHSRSHLGARQRPG